jgi:serine phosphatase RsbU (regulator of sigma subunit)
MDGARGSLLRRFDLISAGVGLFLTLVAGATVASLLSLHRSTDVLTLRATPAVLAERDVEVAIVRVDAAETAPVGDEPAGRDGGLVGAFGRAREDARSALDLLQTRVTGDDDTGRRLAEQVRTAFEPWSAAVAPGTARTRDPAATERLLATLRSRLDALRSHLAERRSEARADMVTAWLRLALVLATGGVASVVFLLLARRLLRRSVAEPLAELAARVNAVPATGEGREVVADGPLEVATLASEIEALRSRLRAELAQAVEDNAALRQRNVAVAELRSRLSPRIADLPGLDVAGELEPAEGVLAGDWFDLRRVGDRGWALLLVDVSGHGAEAGILALQLKQLLIPVLADGMSPGAALAWATRHVEDTEDRFATALVVVGSLDDDAIAFANAGHPPPFLGRPGRLRRLAPTGPLLTPVLADLGWQTGTDRLEVGERLIAYTDGVVEARDSDGVEFGEERLAEIVDAEHGSAADVVAACLAAVRGFQDVARDDSTIAVVRKVAQRSPADR